MAQAVLRLDEVTVRFDDVVALDRLTLEVAPGEVVGLLGHNGAGKTTTVRTLAGLVVPVGGTVRVDDLDPQDDGPAVRRRLGVLPAQPIVDDRLTASQNLRFAAEVFGVDPGDRDARIRAGLAAFELTDRAEDRVAGFSTGMRQRLSLARVLLPDPEILLLDEPTSALDPVAARQVRRVLTELAQERRRTVVLCTHDLAEAEQLCDRVVVLEHGRVVAAGGPAELAAEHGTGGIVLHVRPDDVGTARTLVHEVAAGEVSTEGAGRVRATGVGRDAVPGLLRALVDAEVDVFELTRLDPTLEDVYLAVHGRRAAREVGA